MSYISELRALNPQLADRSDAAVIRILPDLDPKMFGGLSHQEITTLATQDNNALADSGRLLWSGAKEATADMITGVEQTFGANWGADEALRRSADDIYQAVDPLWRRDIEKAGFRDDSENTAAGLIGSALKSGGSIAPSAGAALLGTALAPVTGGGSLVALAAPAITGALGNAAMIGGSSYNSTKQSIEALSFDELAKEDTFRPYLTKAMETHGATDKAFQEARSSLAHDLAGEAHAQGGAIGAVSGLVLGPILSKAVRGGSGVVGGFAEGSLSEGGQELFESGAEAYGSQKALRDATGRAINYDEVAQDAAFGAVLGGASGGVLGAATGALTPRRTALSEAGDLVEEEGRKTAEQGGDALDQERAKTQKAAEIIPNATIIERRPFGVKTAADLGVQFNAPQQDWSAYDQPASSRGVERSDDLTEIDRMMQTARKMGFEDEAIRLGAARGLFVQAERARESGDHARASSLAERGNQIVQDIVETSEPAAASTSSNFPVPYVAQGELEGGDLVPSPASQYDNTINGQVFTKPARAGSDQRPAALQHNPSRRLTDQGIIYSDEPSDVRAAREQRQADNFNALYGQEGQTPGVERISLSGHYVPANADTLQLGSDKRPALPQGNAARTVTQTQIIDLQARYRQAIKTPVSKRTPEQKQAVIEYPALQQAIQAGDVVIDTDGRYSPQPGAMSGNQGVDMTLPGKVTDNQAPVAGKQIDKDWTEFAPESGTLNIPRAEMPQVKAEHRGALVNFLNARGIEHEQTEVNAADLKPTQREFSPEKVAKAREFQGGDRSILVSSDGHVADGHHQWLAKRDNNEPIKAIQLKAPIRDLLPLVHEFPSSDVAGGAQAPASASMTGNNSSVAEDMDKRLEVPVDEWNKRSRNLLRIALDEFNKGGTAGYNGLTKHLSPGKDPGSTASERGAYTEQLAKAASLIIDKTPAELEANYSASQLAKLADDIGIKSVGNSTADAKRVVGYLDYLDAEYGSNMVRWQAKRRVENANKEGRTPDANDLEMSNYTPDLNDFVEGGQAAASPFTESGTGLKISGNPDELIDRLQAAGIKAMRRKDGVTVSKKYAETARLAVPVKAENVDGVRLETFEDGRVALEDDTGSTYSGTDREALLQAHRERQDKQDNTRKVKSEQAKKRFAREPNPEVDDLITAIALAGGINRKHAEGVDPADFMRRVGIKYVFPKTGGRSLDEMAEQLEQYGYLSGTERTRELQDKLDRALRGEDVRTVESQIARLEEAEDIEVVIEALDPWDELPHSTDSFFDQLPEFEPLYGVSPQDQVIAELVDKARSAGVEQRVIDDIIDFSEDHADAVAQLMERTNERETKQAGDSGRSGQAADGRGAQVAGETEAGNRGRETETDRANQDQDDFLSSYTEDDLSALDRRHEDAARQEERQRLEAERRREADLEASDFRLSGSNAAADIAASGGQSSLFGASGKPTQAQVNDLLDRINDLAEDGVQEGITLYNVNGVDKAFDSFKFGPKEKAAFMRQLAKRDDASEVLSRLENLYDTPWAKQAIQGALVRQAIDDLIAGNEPDYANPLMHGKKTNIADAIRKRGAEGLWDYLVDKKVIGHPEKPINAVNGSFLDCNPSRNCAKYCYATRGHYVYANSINKAELVTWAVETDPKRVAKRIASEYKATAEFLTHKALRLFDKGDLSAKWLPVIEELNRQGVRVQVFSKNPNVLRKVSDINVRMMSLDETNLHLADEHPDLPVALVYDGSEKQTTWALENAERLAVILPIKIGQRLLKSDELSRLWDNRETRARLCPIDTGTKKLGDWNCTTCDKGGGIGCFHKSTTQKVLDALKRKGTDLTDLDAIQGELNELAGQLDNESRNKLLQDLAALLSATRAGIDQISESGASDSVYRAGTGVSGSQAETDRRWRGDGRGRVDEPGKRSVSSRKRGKSELSDEGQFDLFAPAAVPAPVAAQQARDNFKVRYKQVDVGSVPVAFDTATTPSEVAHILAPFRKHAQETMLALVTDKQGKVINLIRHTKGAKDASSVYPSELIAAIASTDGAANVWFGHNHPSGSLSPSQADYSITERLLNLLDGTGIEYQGHVIVAHGDKSVYFKNQGSGAQRIPTKAATRNRTVNITERVLRKRDMADTHVVDGPASAMSLAKSIESEDAIILLDNKHAFLGTVSLSADEMQQLRKDGQVNRILTALAETNAGAVLIKTNSAFGASNVSRFLNRFGDVRVLDWLSTDKNGSISSDANMGGNVAQLSGAFMRRDPSVVKADQAAAGISKTRAQAIADEFMAAYNGNIPLEVIVGDSQESIYGAGASVEKVGRIKGAYHPARGAFTLAANNLSSAADARATIRHEILGHYGLNTFKAEDKRAILDTILASKGQPGLNATWDRIADLYHDKPADVQAEEVFAAIAEETRGPGQQLLDRVMALLNKAMRAVGLTKHPVSRSELRRLVATIADGIRSGERTQQNFPTTDDAQFRRSSGPGDNAPFEQPDETRVGVAVRKIADKFQVLKALQQEIDSKGGRIDDSTDTYMAEELFHGKAEEDLRVMRDTFVEPLAKKLAASGIKQSELDEYMYALHAKERNDHIASINPNKPELQDGGSGMTNKEAAEVKARVRASGKQAQYDQVAAIVQDILAARREILVSAGLEEDSVIDTWQAKYANYVPLKGWAQDEKQDALPRTGKGFGIGGKESKRALGRTSQAASPSSYAIQDLTETLIRKRKNEVGNVFLDMVEANPNKDYWQVFTDDNPEKDRKITKRADGSEEVVEKAVPMAMFQDRYFTTKRDGKTYYIKLEDERLMKAMKNIGPDTSNFLIRSLASVNRVLSALNTSYNPEFIVGNFARDVQTATLNLSAEQSRDDGKIKGERIVKQTVKDVPKAMRTVYRALRGKAPVNDEWSRWFDGFRKAGAQTGYYDMKDIDGQSRDIQELVAIAEGGWKGGLLKWTKASARLVEDTNRAVENAVRLSAYVNARKAGISEAKAASLAKNMTVNFNRRGEVGTTLNALYMFANASIQGSANFVRTMVGLKGVKGDPMWSRLNTAQKLAVGMMAGAYALAAANRMAAGDDDDGENWYDKVPDYVKERNLVIMKSLLGGKADGSYWKIPLPYGYNIFHVLGSNVEAVAGGDTSVPKAATGLALAAMGSFSPIGFQDSQTGAGVVMKNIAPTILKPFVDVGLNENFMGSSIYNENLPFGAPKPDSALVRRSTPAGYQAVTGWLNQVSGGSQWRSGVVDVNPDVMRYFVDYALGGAGKFALGKVPDNAYNFANGMEQDAGQVIFLNRVAGRVMPYEDQTRFYDRRNEVGQLDAELKALRGKDRMSFFQEHKTKLALRGLVKQTEDQLKVLRKQRGAIYAKDLVPSERDRRLQEMEERMKIAVDRFNLAYRDAG